MEWYFIKRIAGLISVFFIVSYWCNLLVKRLGGRPYIDFWEPPEWFISLFFCVFKHIRKVQWSIKHKKRVCKATIYKIIKKYFNKGTS